MNDKTKHALKLAHDYLLSKQMGAHIIAAIREALTEQPAQQQEPVAWYDEEYDCAYTAAELDGGNVDGLLPLYTSPPASKPWVGLTDEEIQKEFHPLHATGLQFARAIEAKLREKNA